MKEKDYDERPWGSYEVLARENNYWVKKIIVNPGARLSLQYHNHRSEQWTILTGIGYAVIQSQIIPITKGTTLNIGVTHTHRIANTGVEPLIFIEVAVGDKLTEHDIIRLQDDYGREK